MHESVSSSGTPSARPKPITSDLSIVGKRRDDLDCGRESERQRSRQRREELWRRVRKRVAGEWSDIETRETCASHEHGRLRQQDDVAAFEVDVFIGRVEPGWFAADGPVSGRVDVAHVEAKRFDRQHAAKRRRVEQPGDHGDLFRLPRQTHADVDRQDALPVRALRDVGQQHRAVEPAGTKDRGALTALQTEPLRSSRYAIAVYEPEPQPIPNQTSQREAVEPCM